MDSKKSGLREMRIKKGLTQTELGNLAGIRQGRISELERGISPTDHEFRQIARVFDLPVRRERKS